jgi:hypothetical protein
VAPYPNCEHGISSALYCDRCSKALDAAREQRALDAFASVTAPAVFRKNLTDDELRAECERRDMPLVADKHDISRFADFELRGECERRGIVNIAWACGCGLSSVSFASRAELDQHRDTHAQHCSLHASRRELGMLLRGERDALREQLGDHVRLGVALTKERDEWKRLAEELMARTPSEVERECGELRLENLALQVKIEALERRTETGEAVMRPGPASARDMLAGIGVSPRNHLPFMSKVLESGPGIAATKPTDEHWVDPLDLLADDAR